MCRQHPAGLIPGEGPSGGVLEPVVGLAQRDEVVQARGPTLAPGGEVVNVAALGRGPAGGGHTGPVAGTYQEGRAGRGRPTSTIVPLAGSRGSMSPSNIRTVQPRPPPTARRTKPPQLRRDFNIATRRTGTAHPARTSTQQHRLNQQNGWLPHSGNPSARAAYRSTCCECAHSH